MSYLGRKSTHPASAACGREERVPQDQWLLCLEDISKLTGNHSQGSQNSRGISPLNFQWSSLPANLPPAAFNQAAPLPCLTCGGQVTLDPVPLQAAGCALLSRAPALAPLSCPAILSTALRPRYCTSAVDEFLQRQKKPEIR